MRIALSTVFALVAFHVHGQNPDEKIEGVVIDTKRRMIKVSLPGTKRYQWLHVKPQSKLTLDGKPCHISSLRRRRCTVTYDPKSLVVKTVDAGQRIQTRSERMKAKAQEGLRNSSKQAIVAKKMRELKTGEDVVASFYRGEKTIGKLEVYVELDPPASIVTISKKTKPRAVSAREFARSLQSAVSKTELLYALGRIKDVDFEKGRVTISQSSGKAITLDVSDRTTITYDGRHSRD